MKYLLWNKAEDYQRGRMERVVVHRRELHLADAAATEAGTFVSCLMDAREKQMVWQRMVTNIQLGENMAVEIAVYATDSEAEVQFVEQLLDQRDDTSLMDKTRRMDDLQQLRVRNPQDILLHQVTGRYLWIRINMWGNGQSGPVIKTIQIFFPRITWNRYLPGLYQGSEQEFLTRYLAIFQTLYQDLDTTIRTDLGWLDVGAAKDGELQWLAGWLHARNSHLWETDRLRRCLSDGGAVFRGLGTVRGLIQTVLIFTCEQPYIKEAQGHEDAYTFTLYIKEAVIADVRRYRALLQVIEEAKPADMRVNLIPLKPFLFLDQDTYLGINSQLGNYGTAVLAEPAALDFVVLGGRHEESDLSAV